MIKQSLSSSSKDTHNNNLGSKTAREMVISAIESGLTVRVFADDRYETSGKELIINMNEKQIEHFISGTTPDLNNTTLGYAMSFLHELGHTEAGGNRRDEEKNKFGIPGSNVEFMNIIRSELGREYGIRQSYVAVTFPNSTSGYLPFGFDSFISIELGIPPTHHCLINNFKLKNKKK